LLLIGMGVDSLSMSLGNLLKIKWVIRTFEFDYARKLLAEALQMDSASTIRERLNAVLEQHGLGGLVRVGK
jgi:phosphotransferase system, enzyme I, PtsP